MSLLNGRCLDTTRSLAATSLQRHAVSWRLPGLDGAAAAKSRRPQRALVPCSAVGTETAAFLAGRLQLQLAGQADQRHTA